MLYHLSDHSALWQTTTNAHFGTGGGGWPAWATWQEEVLSTFDVGICVRQPIPTYDPTVDTPLHIDGWSQNGEGIWQTGIVQAFDDLYDLNGIPPILYLGFASGDSYTVGEDRPYLPAPTLSSGGVELSEPAYRTAFDGEVAWAETAAYGTAIIYIDGSANIDPESNGFAAIEALRTRREAQGRYVGIESPPDHAVYPHLTPFPVGATWGSFVNRQFSNRWPTYRKPRLVYTNDSPPAWVTQAGDIGGWSAEYHTMLIDRAIRVIKRGGIAAMNLRPAYTAGYTSITQYFAAFGRKEQPQ